MIRVLFVSTGSICRAPMAHAIFRQRIREEGLADRLTAFSAGTTGIYRGSPPDPRALAVLERNGFDGSDIRAKAVRQADFGQYEQIVAMSAGHVTHLRWLAPRGSLAQIRQLVAGTDVPDPYRTGDFEAAYATIWRACRLLLLELRG